MPKNQPAANWYKLKIRRETLTREYDKLKQIMKSEILSSFFPARKIFKVWKWVSGRPKISFIWPSGHKSWRWYIFFFSLVTPNDAIVLSIWWDFLIDKNDLYHPIYWDLNDLCGPYEWRFVAQVSFLPSFVCLCILEKKMCARNVSMSVRLRLKIKCDQNRSKILRTVMR